MRGESGSYRRGSDDGFWGEHHFCPRCAASVFYRIERRPGMISIAVGAFADPAFAEPTVSVYTERQHRWLRIATDPPVEEMF